MSKLTDYIHFNDTKLAAKYADRPIPIDTLFEAYFDGAIDIPGDIYELLENRYLVAAHQFTPAHVKYFFTKFVPEFVIHSKELDQKLVRSHYDRGNDFFSAFLGPRMVYTSGFFTNPGQTVEAGQDQKMDLVCQKVKVKPGDSFLDIGCGWGTLAMHAAEHYGAQSTAVTLSENQAAFARAKVEAKGLTGKVDILCCDYRDMPKKRYKRITNLEMVEHVGVKHLGSFYSRVYDMLEDQGIFYMQWTGLRRRSNIEDLVWGLFMAKYIFPGADASLPLAPMMNVMEKAGFEIHTVENVSEHYRLTIRKWHDNWISNRAEIVQTYGERWYRIWHWFLAWAAVIAGQGTAACFQVVANKNLNHFDRSVWIGESGLGERSKFPQRAPAKETTVNLPS